MNSITVVLSLLFLSAWPRAANASALIEAVKRHNGAEVERLLKGGEDPNQADSEKDLPLTLAAYQGDCGIVASLLKHGADVNARDSDRTALLHATYQQHVDCVKALLAARDVDVDTMSDPAFYTPLMVTAFQDDATIARMLLERGADVNKANTGGTTALIIAAQYGNSDVVRVLASAPKIDLEYRRQGLTAEELAAYFGHVETTRILREARVKKSGVGSALRRYSERLPGIVAMESSAF